MPPAAAQTLREQRRKPTAKICTEMEDNPARENKKVWLKNKQEKARRQGGAFAVYTVRQSRAEGLETAGFFGIYRAGRDRGHTRVANMDLV